MTWTFAGTGATDLDKIRILIGDTDTNDQQLTDELIVVFLSEAGGNIYRAAALCAESLAAKYSRMVDIKIEGLSSSYSQRAKAYQNLATRMRRSADQEPGSLGTPLAPGISIDDMESANADTDRVKPSFEKGQFDHPSARAPSPEESSS